VSLKKLLKSKATPESWTLGGGAPGDPHRMTEGEPEVVHSGTFVTYEKTDVDTRAVARLGTIVMAITIVAVGATYGLFRAMSRLEARNDPPPPPMALTDPNRRPPEPRLQTTPASDYEAQRDREQALLEGYGIDRQTGKVHIPIDEAIRRYVQRAGTPPTPAASASPAAASSTPPPAPGSPAPAGAASPAAGHHP
jgi:hypothetical protein